jgi:hypothetical protein
MTELAMCDDHAVATTPRSATLSTLSDWAAEVRAAGTIAEGLCRTSFVPKHFQGKPAETAAAILTGFELGLSPMAAVRSIFIIGGTPGMYAKAMVAVVQAQGHEVWAEEQSDERVVVCGRRKGSATVVSTMWDRARVMKAKLTGNAKYQESPQQMMVARGQAEICRQIASDALHGIPYSVEELDDMPPVVATATVGRVSAAEILGTQDAAVVPESAPEPHEAAERGITAAQSRKMYGLLRQAGREDKDLALVYIAGVIKREISSTKELNVVEAGAVIDALEAKGDEPTLDDGWPDAAQPAVPDGQ